jgi:hypothetical protein
MPDKANSEQHDTTIFHINNCPQSLIDRAKAKAALKGMGVAEWVIQVLERETKKLKPLQQEYKAEKNE